MTKSQIEQASKAMRMIAEAQSILDNLDTDLQKEYDDKSDKWRESEKGTEWEEAMGYVKDAHDSCDEAVGALGGLEGVDL